MFVPIRNFGKYGVIHDTVGETLPIGAWTDARNVRFTGREFEKMLEPALDVEFTPGGGMVRQAWSDSISSYVAVATQTALYFLRKDDPDNSEWVLAGSGYDTEGQWQAFAWGDTCVFNNGVDAPQIFNNGTLQFEDLPKWGLISTATDIANGSDPSKDTKASCKVLLPYKNFLVALGVSENGLYQPNTVWWSDSTALAGLATSISGGGPPDWDYESPASLSGKTEVGTGDGPIRWGAQLNENLIIYTDASASALTFVGGTFVMSTRRLFNKGCAGLHLAVEFQNQHFVVAQDQIYVHDGSTVKLIAKDRVEDEFFKRAGKGGRYRGDGGIDYTTMQLVKNPDRKELYLLFNGEVTEWLPGTEGVSDLELVLTPDLLSSGNPGFNDSYSNNGYIHSDGNGTVLATLEGGWDEDFSSYGANSGEAYLYRSDDFGLTWSKIDPRTVFPTPDDSGNSRIFGYDYDSVLDRWWVMNYSSGSHAQYSDDGGHTFVNVTDIGNSALGDIYDAVAIKAIPGQADRVMIGGTSILLQPGATYYRTCGYLFDEGSTFWDQRWQRASSVGGAGWTYQMLYYNGRYLYGQGPSTYGIYEYTNFSNSTLDPTFLGAFPGAKQWSTKGDGIILAAAPTQSYTAAESYIAYYRADITDSNNTVITQHQIPTDLTWVGSKSAEIYCNGDYFIAYCMKSDVDDRFGTTTFALFISQDGINWGDQYTFTLPASPLYNGTIQTTFKATYAGAGAWVFTYVASDDKHRVFRIVIDNPGASYTRSGRFALLYNFEDDNYTWMDASVVSGDELDPAKWLHYSFDNGWVTRWDSDNLSGVTWDNLDGGYAPWGQANWDDFANAGTEKNMYWLSNGSVYKGDQAVETSGVKSYFVERVQIDLDDLNAKVPLWTTNLVKHLKQFVFHLQTPYAVGSSNTFDITAGWSQNLMDPPDWVTSGTVELNTTANSGKYKWDVRTSGRYLALRMDFDQTAEIRMTGADIDVEPRYGR